MKGAPMTYFNLNEIIMKSVPRDWVNSAGKRVYTENIDITITLTETDEIIQKYGNPVTHSEICYRGVPVMNSDVIFVDKYRAIPYDGLNFDGATGFNYKIAYILSYARDQAEYGEFVKAYGITHVE